jgi:hypothetical protein
MAISGPGSAQLPDDPHFAAEGNQRVAEALQPHVLAALDGRP